MFVDIPNPDPFRLLEAVPEALAVVDNRGRIVFLNSRMAGMFGGSRDSLIGKTIESLMPRRYREGHVIHREAFSLYPRNRPMGVCRNLIGQRMDGGEFPVEVALSPLTGEHAGLTLAMVTDVSERKRFDGEQKQLIAELNNRIGQLLRTIQFVATTSLADEPALNGRRDRFIAKLHSLSHTHSLVAKDPQRGAPLRKLLETELAASSSQVNIDGIELTLRHEAALSFAILLHELAGNAIKFGALSAPAGRLSVRWTVNADHHPATLFFQWKETGGPAKLPQSHTRSGRTIIEEMARELGNPRSSYGPDEFRFELDLVLDEIGWVREWSF